jgi:hypothetical protein
VSVLAFGYQERSEFLKVALQTNAIKISGLCNMIHGKILIVTVCIIRMVTALDCNYGIQGTWLNMPVSTINSKITCDVGSNFCGREVMTGANTDVTFWGCSGMNVTATSISQTINITANFLFTCTVRVLLH